ncbi:MAG: hypothetical protein NTZ68_02870 [Candidatus Dependentiae bacterium]|nr:hypothetical protein [Candidatus Dependentiae bacterium]
MKSAKFIMMSCFFISSVVLMAPSKEGGEPFKQRIELYNQAIERAKTDHKLEIHRVLQTREEDGIAIADQMLEVCKQEIEEKFADVVTYLDAVQNS